MRKKIKSIMILLSLAFMFSMIDSPQLALAVEVGGEGQGAGEINYGTCGYNSWCHTSELYNGRSGAIQGVRMTVVNSSGQRISNSADFILNYPYPLLPEYSIREGITNRSSNNDQYGLYHIPSKPTRLELVRGGEFGYTNRNYNSSVNWVNLEQEGAFKKFIQTATGGVDSPGNVIEDLKTVVNDHGIELFEELYLSKLGYDYRDHWLDEEGNEIDQNNNNIVDYKEHYILVEPLAYYRIYLSGLDSNRPAAQDEKRFIGTVSDIAYLMQRIRIKGHAASSSGERIENPYVNVVANHYFTGTPFLNNILPGSIYLDSTSIRNLAENNILLNGVTLFGLNATPDVSGRWFTVGLKDAGVEEKTDLLRGYKCLGNATNSARDRCYKTTPNTSREMFEMNILSNYAFGMGVLYINDVIDEPDPDLCDFSNPNVLLLECCEEDGAKGHRLYDHICDLDTDDDKPNCDTKSSIGNCTSLTQTSIEETKNWGSCIYNNSDYREISRSYCNVYCSETVSTNFPGGLHATALAGHHFLLRPISITSQKECRAQVDLEGLKGNVERSKKSVESAFNEWQRQKARSSLISDGFNESETNICDTDCNNPYYVCKSEEDTLLPNRMDCQPPTPPADLDEDGNVIKTYPKPDPYRGERKCGSVTNYYLKTPRTSRKNYYNHQGDSVSTSIGSYCRPSARPTSSVSTAWKVYDDSLKAMERTIDNINNCYTWVDTLQYNTNPNLFVNFEYMNQIKDIKLVSNSVEARSISHFNDFGDEDRVGYISTSDQISTLECYDSSRGCVEINRSGLPWNKVNAVTINKTIRYSLPPDTYRYVDKTTSISSNYPSNGGLYFDIGSANIPVHYSTLPGTKNLTFRYSDLGTNGKFNSVIDSVNNYYCNYNVEKGFVIPDPTPGGSGGGRGDVYDYNFVYRPIDLSTPFPGKDGNGRGIGSNWSGNENLIKEDVFNQEPKYRITLDNRSIRAIRDYNKTNSYDNFDMTCDQGYNCKSNFLREDFMQGVIVINQDINYNPIVSR